MSEKRGTQPFVSEPATELTDLRTLAWRLRGLSFLIQHLDHDAVANEDEMAGIGLLFQDIGERVLEHAQAEEEKQFRARKNRTAPTSRTE